MFFQRLKTPGLGQNSYILGCGDGLAVVIDPRRVHLLDVRDEYEWNEKRLPGAIHQYVGHLEENLRLLPKDSEIVVHCNVGHRSGLAASILQRNGYLRVHNMLGGITAWEKLGFPLGKSQEEQGE